jgi:hypothetical protein
MNRVFEPNESFFEGLFELEWPPAHRWPRDFRKFIVWVFAGTAPVFAVLAFFGIPHAANDSFLRSLLLGRIFESSLAAVSGSAAWVIWKAHPFARVWAIAASLLYLSEFIRPFLIPIRPVRDRGLASLIIGLVGIAAFAWPDRSDTLRDTGNSS